MSKNKPLVSVVLPAYNAEDFINNAIQSILGQTFSDFELIIINDGSRDSTLQKIKSFKDDRIVIMSRENRGLVASLNEGIAKASTNIIARQDADDISEPTRLEKQVAEFRKNSNLVLLGTSISTINSAGEILNTHTVLHGRTPVKAELLIRSPFAHGSVMFRKDAFYNAGKYTAAEWPAEDYGLWLRMAKLGDVDNLSEPLYRYMENNSGISAQNHKQQLDLTRKHSGSAWLSAGSYIASGRILQQTDTSANERLINNYSQILQMLHNKRLFLLAGKILCCLLFTPSLLRRVAGTIRRSA